MDVVLKYRGRVIRESDLPVIRALIEKNPTASCPMAQGKSIPRIPRDDIEFTPLPHSVEPSEITKDSRFRERCFWLFFPSLFARNLLRPGEGARG